MVSIMIKAVPSSTDVNPIEKAFLKLKAHLNMSGARTISDLFGDIAAIYVFFSPRVSSHS